ncbi:Uncharacterised protein [uncultured archaeon]|nr:Uncharacterised protein [uncultured archaeon]
MDYSAPFFLSPLFVEYVLPFVLVFTLMFAILQKTKLLGDEAKRVNAIIGLVVGLLLVAFKQPRDIVVVLMPFLAVFATVLLVFMLLYGFIVGKKDGDVLGYWWKVAFAAILSISFIVFLLAVTGYFNIVWNFLFNTSQGSAIWMNAILLAIIVGAVVAVVRGEK